jgi:hypothetical protein
MLFEVIHTSLLYFIEYYYFLFSFCKCVTIYYQYLFHPLPAATRWVFSFYLISSLVPRLFILLSAAYMHIFHYFISLLIFYWFISALSMISAYLLRHYSIISAYLISIKYHYYNWLIDRAPLFLYCATYPPAYRTAPQPPHRPLMPSAHQTLSFSIFYSRVLHFEIISICLWAFELVLIAISILFAT